jgi:hypothetical protein
MPTSADPPEMGSAFAPAAIRQAAFRAVMEEDFADNHRGWPSDPRSTAWPVQGGYRLSAREPGRFVAVGAPLARPVADVVVTATFRKVGGPPGGGYGLIVRDRGPGPRDGRNQAGRYYVFEVGDRGEVGAWRREGDRWADLVPWAPSAAVRPGGMANELEARAAGERLTFLVNGERVTSVDEPEPQPGAVGLFVGGDGNEVLVERLLVAIPR